MSTALMYSIESKVYKHLQSGQEDNDLILLITAKCPYNFHCLSDNSVCGLFGTEECPLWPLNPLRVREFLEVIRDGQQA